MIPTITKEDLELINKLSSRKYTGNSIISNASVQENDELKKIKLKLKKIAEYFGNKYNQSYGPFSVSVASGNPIALGGVRFNRVWSGIFKGATNKQYAAQISFVMDPDELYLDVGFYFGRAASHSVTKDQKNLLEQQLKDLAVNLSNSIKSNGLLLEKYNSLFDFGFRAFSNRQLVLSNDWLELIKIYTNSSQIIVKIPLNDFNIIENATIDSYVSLIISLMGGINNKSSGTVHIPNPPLTPEQRARQAERLALIGQNGELFAMNYERNRLKLLGINNAIYPRHVALESMSYGYDILSIDEKNNEIFIEVKTTTRLKKDINSKRFYLSTKEYDTFVNDKIHFRLYRIYDIEGLPQLDELDLDLATKTNDGYIIKY